MRTTIRIFFILTLVLWSLWGQAATVTTTADSGPGSLREAISNAAADETIDFAVSGLITLSSGELAINTNLTIAGPGLTNLTIARSSAAGTPDFRIFNITAGSVKISGLSISNG